MMVVITLKIAGCLTKSPQILSDFSSQNNKRHYMYTLQKCRENAVNTIGFTNDNLLRTINSQDTSNEAQEHTYFHHGTIRYFIVLSILTEAIAMIVLDE